MTDPQADAAKDSPGVLIFPPILFGGAMLIGVLIHLIWPIHVLPTMLARTSGVIVFLLGGLLAHWAQTAMTRAGTNIRPDQPSLALVTSGPFALSRNPLYVAALCLCLGVALLVDGLVPLLMLIPIVAILQWGVVLREERYLAKKFGEPYNTYRGQVRRWF